MSNEIDNQAFEYMTATADNGNVDLWKQPEIGPPAMARNIFGQEVEPFNNEQLLDIVLGTVSGSGGNMKFMKTAVSKLKNFLTSNKRVLKDSGEEMVTLHKGITDWWPGKMVKDGKLVPGSHYTDKFHWGKSGGFRTAVTRDPNIAKGYATRTDWKNISPLGPGKYKGKNPMVLEFKVPKSWLKDNILTPKLKNPKFTELVKEQLIKGKGHEINVEELPFRFLTNVIKLK